MTSFSFCHSALRFDKESFASAISLRRCSRRSRLTSSVSFISACSSICIWVSLRSAKSTSSGMLSISMRRRLAASSMRSMALSGRKRSEM